MSARDQDLERLLGPIVADWRAMAPASTADVLVTSEEQLRACLRRAAEAGRKLGQKDSLEGPCSRAEAFARGKAAGARDAENRVAELEQALRRYGEHLLNCPTARASLFQRAEGVIECTCGLDALLARQEPS